MLAETGCSVIQYAGLLGLLWMVWHRASCIETVHGRAYRLRWAGYSHEYDGLALAGGSKRGGVRKYGALLAWL